VREILRKEVKAMINYTKPAIVMTVAATVAIQGVDKHDHFQDNIVGTSAAYEADE
jgi:hypothetical protein